MGQEGSPPPGVCLCLHCLGASPRVAEGRRNLELELCLASPQGSRRCPKVDKLARKETGQRGPWEMGSQKRRRNLAHFVGNWAKWATAWEWPQQNTGSRGHLEPEGSIPSEARDGGTVDAALISSVYHLEKRGAAGGHGNVGNWVFGGEEKARTRLIWSAGSIDCCWRG